MKCKLQKAYSGNIALSEGFVREYMPRLSDLALRVYLYGLALAAGGEDLPFGAMAQALGCSENDLIAAFSELEKLELGKLKAETFTLLSLTEETQQARPAQYFTPDDIEAMRDKDVKMLVGAAEKRFGKLLNYREINTLIELYRYNGVPAEVLAVVIAYAAESGKKNMSYVQKVALDWHEKEIDTPQKAHAYIQFLEACQTYYARLKDTLGIYGRELTKKEKAFADSWMDVYSLEQIKTAYETTVDATGKISFAYTDKILRSDGEKPVVTNGKRTAVKPSRFHNFEQKQTDFNDVEKSALRKLMKKAGKGV